MPPKNYVSVNALERTVKTFPPSYAFIAQFTNWGWLLLVRRLVSQRWFLFVCDQEQFSWAINLKLSWTQTSACNHLCHGHYNITIEFMFAGINMFWARLRLILKCVWEGPKTYLCPRTKTLLLLLSLWISHQRCEKTSTKTLKWLLDFDWLLR